MQFSAGGREAAFYPTASHGRIKENPNPLRSLRLYGEYVTVIMKRCIKLILNRQISLKEIQMGNPFSHQEIPVDIPICNRKRCAR